jgi:signal recognition particle GTPase
VPEDVKKMILNILVKNQEATEKKRKIFQYIEKDRDNDEGNEISSMNKEKRIVSGSGSTQTTINQLLKKI